MVPSSPEWKRPQRKTPVTKTCSQCGAVLPSSVRACHFCDTSFSADSWAEDLHGSAHPEDFASSAAPVPQDAAWRRELATRMEAYRTRKRKLAPNAGQSRLPFEDHSAASVIAATELADAPAQDDFSFSIAIGRYSPQPEKDGPMDIDVSVPAKPSATAIASPAKTASTERCGLYPVASLDERRWAALIDAACLAFAYGGFLALFGSLGGQFTVSKLSAAVCAATLGIVYLQYFALFTIFGGTTPGMMFRGLQVASFNGDLPTPRQMLVRSLGYIISGGTFFLGFFWAWWDEDALTWHDRLSRTYLSVQPTHADLETSGVVRSH